MLFHLHVGRLYENRGQLSRAKFWGKLSGFPVPLAGWWLGPEGLPKA